MSLGTPAAAAFPFLPEGVLFDLLAVSLTGVNVLRPVYDPAGGLTDFAIEYLNPAAQRMTGLGERPGGTILTRFSDLVASGLLAFYRRVFESGEAGRYDFNYPADGLENYCQVAARRSGDWLVVSFTDDVSGQVLARQKRETQPQRLGEIFAQAPVAICVFQGPDYVLDVVNPRMLQLWGRSSLSLVGRPFFEAMPELRAQGMPELLADVRRTGQPFAAQEMAVQLARHQAGETGFYDFVYEPLRDAQHQVVAVLCVATDVTEQVRARRQVEQLNAELEARVQERTQQLAHAQATAERERAQLQALLEQAPVAIALFQGQEVRVASANEQMAALWGRTPAQVVGRLLLEAVPELHGQGFEEMIQQVLATRVPYVGTEAPATILKDGQLISRYYNFSCQPVYNAQGEVLGVLNVGTEVTEQVEARRDLEQLNQELEARVQKRTQQLRHQQGLLRQILRQVPAAIATLSGPEHQYTFFNDAYQALSGGRTQLGLPVAEVLPEVVAQGFVGLLDQVYTTGQPVVGTEAPTQLFQVATGQFELRYLDFIYQPLVNEQHQTEDMLVFMVDVSDQVLARRAVEASAQRLRLLTDALPVLIGYLDREHRYQFANEAYRAWFHQDPAALLGRSVREVVGEEAYAVAAGYMERALAGERLDFEATMPYRKDFTRHIRTSFIPDVHQGVVQGFYTLVTDITEQVAARQQVERLNEELQATNQALHHTNTQLRRTNTDLDTFVYAASHDLKAPIANIEGLLEALREYLPTQEQEPMVPRLVGMMEGAIMRFQQTVGHLTDVSRLQNEGTPLLETVDLAAVLEDVRLDLLPLLESTRAELVLALTACSPLAFSTKHLRSVLFNLLSNAVKYRAPDRLPLVHVHTQCTATHLVLDVQDNGLGLDATQQSRLFTMFRRLHTHVEGSGVGLYLIKRTLENAGGTIAVRSQPGVGSTFTVTIPRAPRPS